MRLCWPAFAVALVFLATPSDAEPSYGGRLLQHAPNSRPVIAVSDETTPPESDTDIFALMSGKCSTLKVAGRDFACRAVAFFQSEQGRANFAIALDDPTDATHIVTRPTYKSAECTRERQLGALTVAMQSRLAGPTHARSARLTDPFAWHMSC